ncbi:hypothetical protein [Streptomyces sp. NPDC017529]|uniref:hypothetical protein n=1 Tax=Streptomyces sp. NPDC017529 TaxID=3365000 RepID=UPI00378CC35D
MASTRWSRRRERRVLRRDLSRFEARLPSLVTGIGFTAQITVTVLTAPPYPQSSEGLGTATRTVLREAAREVSARCDPADLASARDVCRRHFARHRSLPTDPPVEFRAEARLDLPPDDQAAVAALLTALRSQSVTDTLRRQKTEAFAQELADPAAVLVRWIERQPDTWGGLPDTSTITKVADAFQQYRPERERAVEYAALDLIREFLYSFPDPPQKRMLYEVLAASMRHAKRPEHAAKAEAILDLQSSMNERGGDA